MCATGFGSINQGEFSEAIQGVDKQGTNEVTRALTKSLVSPIFSPTQPQSSHTQTNPTPTLVLA